MTTKPADAENAHAENQRAEAAAEWVVRLQSSTLAEEDVAAWMAWCEADPLNRKAFDAMEEVWSIAGKVDPVRVQAAPPVLYAPHRWSPKADKPGIFGTRTLAALATGALAATVAFFVANGTSWRAPPSAPAPVIAEMPIVQVGSEARLETGRGHMTSARLEDGSRVDLGAQSALTVHYTAQSRTIVADEGEAFFQVAKSRERPFVVQAGAVTVTAVGTSFSIAREDHSVAVVVTEGAVEIRASPNATAGAGAPPLMVSVVAGQRVLFDQGKLIQSADGAPLETVESRREGRLEFRDEPLRLAVARVSRYADRDITVGDPKIENFRVTGTAYIDRVDAWLAGIEAVLPVKAQRLDKRHILIRSVP